MPVKPVVAIDIDGTLGDYHGHFMDFAEGWLGEHFADRNYRGHERFWEFLNLDHRLYRDIKLAYRQGGMKRTMPVFEGAAELTNNLRRAGAEIWIATTRPWQRLDNVDPDTREWLRRNGIVYDYMIYGDDKYPQLRNLVDTHRIVGVLEDLPEQVEEAEALSMNPVVINRQHNEDWRQRTSFEKWKTADTMEHAAKILTDRVEEWAA